MVKKIGNYLLMALMVLGVSGFNAELDAQASVSFSITDFQDKKLGWAGAGVPFLLTLVLTGEEQIADEPEIQGLDDFHVRSAGTSTDFHIMNSVTTVVQRYKYIVRIDKMGNYQIGPATVKAAGGIIQSSAHMLTVKDEPQQAEEKDVSDAFLHMAIEPEAGYKGQKFILKVRFYSTGNAVITRLFKPEFDGFWVGQFKESIAGLEEVNGLDYRFVEYEAPIVPQESGDLVIQTMEAEYQIPSQRKSGFGFFRMFNSNTEFRRTVSNSITLPVAQLPEHSQKVNGVGEFNSFSGAVDRIDAQTGHGIVYTLTLEGDADLEHVESSQLIVPENVTYYDSKSIIEPANVDHGSRKIFEYIIQAQEPGDIILPSQQFVYFDPIAEEYKTLYTKPITLKITQGELDAPQYEQKTYDTILYDEPTDNLLPLNEHGPWLPVQYRVIPFWVFIFLLLLPLLIGLSFWLWGFYRWYYDKNITYFAYASAFTKANNSLRACQERNEAAQLYDLFVRLFAARSHLVPSSVTNEYVRTYLRNKLSREQMDAWNRFFKTVQEIRFYGKTPDGKICEEAKNWLKLFEKVL